MDRERLVHAACRAPVPADPRALAYSIGPAATQDRLLLTADARATQWAGPLSGYVRPRMPVSGKDLIDMGLAPGPAVSRRLAEIEKCWIEAGFPPERDRVMAIAREVLGVR
jgi:hypothetical protein